MAWLNKFRIKNTRVNVSLYLTVSDPKSTENILIHVERAKGMNSY